MTTPSTKNIKVKSIRRVQLEHPIPVYDATVPVHHNFALANGVVVHNTARSARVTKPFRYQETLGLKGKMSNALKTKMSKLLASEEILNVLLAIGFDAEATDPLAKLRVGKIILMSDPDPDGYHINSLLLTLLQVMFPGLFERGLVYTLVSPKYILSANNQQYFAMTLEELKSIMPKGVDIARATYLKGWGEATASSMRTIGFDPTTRRLVQIQPPSKKDLAEFIRLMGDDPTYKKEMLGISVDTGADVVIDTAAEV